MFDGQFRSQIEAGLRPVGNSIRKTGITADMITAFGLLMAVAAAVAIGAGALRLGLLLLVLTGLPDLLDGAVAKASGSASVRGAFFDSVSDRLTDGLLFDPLLVPVMALIVVLNMITAGQRFVKVWRQATAQTPALSDRRRRRAARRTPRPRSTGRSSLRRPGGSV